MSLFVLACALGGIFIVNHLAGEVHLQGVMLIIILPYVMLSAFTWLTRSSLHQRVALALMIGSLLIAGMRVLYSYLGFDQWYAVPLLILSLWEIGALAVALCIVGIIAAYRRLRTLPRVIR